MLNLNCVICAELFGHSDDVHVTTCGHLFHFLCLRQWLERSKSCPQCRNKCTDRSIFRVYFNIANLDISRIDVCSLQEQLDNANLQVKLKESKFNKAQEQVKNLKDIQKKCMLTINGLEKKLQKNEFIILSYSEQVKLLKTDVKLMDDLRKEVKTLKEQIETMESVSAILTGTQADAEKLLKNENNPKKLSVLVTMLKRELRVCENKKTDLRNMLKVVQSDLRKENEFKKVLEERISQLESENYQLSEKLKTTEAASVFAKDPNNRLSESPTVDPKKNETRILMDERRFTISPTIKNNVRKIEESSSPYMNIKSSSVGLMPLFKLNQPGADTATRTTCKLATLKIASPSKLTNCGAVRKTASDLSEKYSIFKKPRLGMAIATTLGNTSCKPKMPNFVSNGFGGSEKLDPFAHNSDEEYNIDMEENQVKMRNKTGNVTKSNSAQSLSNRLKTGGLRNFKVTK